MSSTTTAITALCTAVVAVVTAPVSRRFPYGVAGLLTVVALVSVVTGFRQPRPAPEEAALWRLLEIAALLVLLRGVVRWSPPRAAVPAACMGAAACALWPVPVLEPSSWFERTGAATFWLLPALAAAVVGGYPRWQAYRTQEAVRRARRRQQRDLARDLHDFVAHEVSAIVTQAQAARFLADTDPARAPYALERIERAGLNALALMDRTVQMLHDADGRAVAATPGIDGLQALVAEFPSAGTASCHLEIDASAAGSLSPPAQAAGYRMVVEGLTNVRRHAPTAEWVTVEVRPGADGSIEVSVTNDVPPDGTRREGAGGGHGLTWLREHVLAAGGTLTAGAHASEKGGTTWRLAATFPGTSAGDDA